MKKELIIAGVLGILSIIIIGGIIMNNQPSYGTNIPAEPSPTASTTVSLEDFKKHDSASDCWIQINGKVYSVTNYLNQHPSGPETILPYCGREDATNAFNTKNGKGPHSSQAEIVLEKMLVGILQ